MLFHVLEDPAPKAPLSIIFGRGTVLNRRVDPSKFDVFSTFRGFRAFCSTMYSCVSVCFAVFQGGPVLPSGPSLQLRLTLPKLLSEVWERWFSLKSSQPEASVYMAGCP